MTDHRVNHIIKIELSGSEGLKTNTFFQFCWNPCGSSSSGVFVILHLATTVSKLVQPVIISKHN